MTGSRIFKQFIEPGLERIPRLEVLHIERHHGREYVVNQTIQRNVFTEFDRKLSRHLAATRGTGFPSFTVSVRVSERGGVGASRPLASMHYPSAPHALMGIAQRAIASTGEAELTIQHSAAGLGEDGSNLNGTGRAQTANAFTVASMEAGLAVCDHLGEADFLDMSGDFDIVIAAPPGDLRPVVMHLQNGSVSIPCQMGTTITPFECPIHDFGRHISRNLPAQGYLASARHALVAVKEAAVMEFRAAAEAQILNFDRALAGRALEAYRMEAAIALVSRLKAGLGDGLSGLSEDAKITALDWSDAIERPAAGSRPPNHAHIVVPHPASIGTA